VSLTFCIFDTWVILTERYWNFIDNLHVNACHKKEEWCITGLKEQRFPDLPEISNTAYLEYLCLPLSSNLIDPTVTHVQISLFLVY
jgi:hypothetical protein